MATSNSQVSVFKVNIRLAKVEQFATTQTCIQGQQYHRLQMVKVLVCRVGMREIIAAYLSPLVC